MRGGGGESSGRSLVFLTGWSRNRYGSGSFPGGPAAAYPNDRLVRLTWPRFTGEL